MSKDHFSSVAETYARRRPRYPRELFEWLASQTPAHAAAWDCGCGNGQASLGLAEFYDTVAATDLSEAQIRNALPHPRIHYSVGTAESTRFDASSLDLVCSAQAAHWLDLPRFYENAVGALKPGGLLAIWAYGLFESDPAVDPIIGEFEAKTVGPYWPAERRWIDQGYKGMPFPFEDIEPPDFTMRSKWELAGWSKTRFGRAVPHS
jgi:SAM-dependent methyltransferase